VRWAKRSAIGWANNDLPVASDKHWVCCT
jgi:hypothetical protein